MAAIAVAMILPLAGPAKADPRTLPVAVPAVSAVAVAQAIQPQVEPAAPVATELPLELRPIGGGVASYYGRQFTGARTASGQRFDPDGLTAAHRTLAFGTKVQVKNPRTGDTVVVTINDRGPFHSNRVIDLSDAAAEQIGIRRQGSGRVELAVLSDDDN